MTDRKDPNALGSYVMMILLALKELLMLVSTKVKDNCMYVMSDKF